MATNTVKLGDTEYKLFEPTPCDTCCDYRPAHLCIYMQGVGIVCDNCQRKQGIAHLNPKL